MAGAYTGDAGQRGLLDPSDITEAGAVAATAADPLGLPQDTPGAHGINDDRITAFMRGYLGGVDACALPKYGGSRGVDPVTGTASPSNRRAWADCPPDSRPDALSPEALGGNRDQTPRRFSAIQTRSS